MAPHSPTARRCIELAAASAPAMLDRAFGEAVTGLQEEEQQATSVTRRQELADAWMELLQRRREWSARYPALLRAAMEAEPVAATAPAPLAGRPTLALVDEDTLAQSLDASRLKQLLAPRLEQPLSELDGLMSSALGLEVVHTGRNPLRPDVFIEALAAVMHPTARPQWPALWMRHLATPLGAELEKLYRQALDVLRDAKLQAASYRVLPSAPSPSSAPAPLSSTNVSTHRNPNDPAPGGEVTPLSTTSSGGSAGLALGGASWADLSRYGLDNELFQHFLFARSQPSKQGLAPAYYAEVDQQLAALETATAEEAPFDPQLAAQHRTLPPVERPHRPVDTATPLDSAVWGRWSRASERSLVRARLKKEASQVGQALGLEVVRKLVDQVGHDPRLLAPVREAVVALEPALLRLALVEPRFFGDEGHAGRRLVERVAERSFKYNDEFAADFRTFFSELRPIFQALNETEVSSDAPFAEALRYLEERWSELDDAEAQGQQVAVDALHFAEVREAEAAKIAWTLSQRPDLEGVPAVVQDFLYGPWALVMAHARLTAGKGQMDPGGWNGVISDLLWSAKTDQTLRDPGRLFSTVPGMLEQLRGGLGLLEQDVAENDTFFQALEKLHRPVLKLRAKSRQGSAAPPVVELDPTLLSTERQKPQRPDRDPYMARSELRAAGFDEGASGPVPLEPQRPAGAVTPATPSLDSLQQGCWVDLKSRGEWRRAQLTWVSSRGTLFMFVSNGGRPHSMTRRTLERLLAERQLRPVEGGAVVQRAIDALSHGSQRREPLAA